MESSIDNCQMSESAASDKHYRTDQKIRYAEIHLAELADNPTWGSNDDWENAHQESFFFHLAGAVDGVLHEVDDRYDLGLTRVDLWSVRDKLKSESRESPAVNLMLCLRRDDTSWLSLLYRWRNYGTHRKHVGRVVTFSTHSRTDNYFTDPKTNVEQAVYPDAGGREVCLRLCTDMKELVRRCRAEDPLL